MSLNPKLELEQEILNKQIDQIHNAVSQLSLFCFEIKKFCITTIFIVLTLVCSFTDDSLDHSTFITTYLTVFFFWLLDSTAYFYQVKLRAMMNTKFDEIRQNHYKLKNLEADISLINHDDAIEESRASKGTSQRVVSGLFNYSMLVYALLFLLNSLAYVLFSFDIIK